MWKKFKVISTTFPLGPDVSPGQFLKDLQSLGSSDSENTRREQILCDACPSLAQALTLLRQSSPIGKKDDYEGVYRVTPVLAGFTPQPGATPYQGGVGVAESVQLIKFQTWADDVVPQATLDKFIRALNDLHPYQTPVIEIIETMQYAGGKTNPLLDCPRANPDNIAVPLIT